jgi:hypothetical protein
MQPVYPPYGNPMAYDNHAAGDALFRGPVGGLDMDEIAEARIELDRDFRLSLGKTRENKAHLRSPIRGVSMQRGLISIFILLATTAIAIAGRADVKIGALGDRIIFRLRWPWFLRRSTDGS